MTNVRAWGRLDETIILGSGVRVAIMYAGSHNRIGAGLGSGRPSGGSAD